LWCRFIWLIKKIPADKKTLRGFYGEEKLKTGRFKKNGQANRIKIRMTIGNKKINIENLTGHVSRIK
jgi:hypothetical protein